MPNFRNLMSGDSGSAALVEVENSALFNDANSETLTRTFGTPTDNNVWTYSVWLYITQDSTNQRGLLGSAGGGNSNAIMIGGAGGGVGNGIRWMQHNGAAFALLLETNELLRDIGWYHLVFACDTGQGTAANRCKIYLNGTQITSFSTATYPSSGLATDVNTAAVHTIGKYSTVYADMYLAEEVFIDGQALTPSSFAEFDETGLYWTPKSSIGALAFGNNGFYLNNVTNAQTDASGNGNTWTNNNTVVTSTHTPTNLIAKVNPLNIRNQTSLTPGTGLVLSNGNMTFDKSSGGGDIMWAMDQYLIPGNKYHFEYTTDSFDSSSYARVATWIGPASYYDSGVSFFGAETAVYRDSYIRVGGSGSNTNYFNNSALTTATITPTTGTRITYEVDMSTIGSTTIRIYEDGVLDITYSSLAFVDEPYTLGFWTGAETDRNGQVTVNFDSSSFEDTPTTDYIGLSTNDVAEATTRSEEILENHFQVALVDHNGSSTAFTQNWSNATYHTAYWIKNRDAAEEWFVMDTLRGDSKHTKWDDQEVEQTDSNVCTFDGGSTITLGSTLLADKYVVYCFRLGLVADGTSNTDGNVTTVCSANQTAGWSCLNWSGINTNPATIGHGLGGDYGLWMLKARTVLNGAIGRWFNMGTDKNVYVYNNGSQTSDNYAKSGSDNGATGEGVFGVTGNNTGTSQSGQTYMGMVFAKNTIFLNVSAYEGNGNADGTFIPNINSDGISQQTTFTFSKSIDSTSDWAVVDNVREGYNGGNDYLVIDRNIAETATNQIDLVTGGIKNRLSTDPNVAETFAYLTIGTPIIDKDGRIIAAR